MNFSVEFQGRIEATTDEGDVIAPLEVIEHHLDNVMDELISLSASDPIIDADLVGGAVRFGLVVDVSNPLSAVEQASGTLRTAIHAAGGCTPDWPAVDATHAWGVRLVEVRSAKVGSGDWELART